MSFMHQNYDPHSDGPDPGHWLVHLALEADDEKLIARAAQQVIPGETFSIYHEETDDGEEQVTLALRIYEETAEGARAHAADLYSRIRTEAALEAQTPVILGHIAASWRSAWLELSREAMELHKQGRYALSIVRVQTVCELVIERALTSLIKEKKPEADPNSLIIRPPTLLRKEHKQLFEELCGQRPTQQSWWQDYHSHVQRRHAIVHAGIVVSYEDSVASIGASHAMRKWLYDLMEAELDLPNLDEDVSD